MYYSTIRILGLGLYTYCVYTVHTRTKTHVNTHICSYTTVHTSTTVDITHLRILHTTQHSIILFGWCAEVLKFRSRIHYLVNGLIKFSSTYRILSVTMKLCQHIRQRSRHKVHFMIEQFSITVYHHPSSPM